MIVRKVKKSDLDEYLVLREETLIEFGYKKISKEKLKCEFIEAINSPNRIIFVLEKDNKINGYVISTILKNVWQRSCYIDDIFIDKHSRRKGLGSILLKALLRAMHKKGIRKFRLGVEIKNKKAFLLYKKLGFKTTHYEMTLKR